jgi:hypothetical protein
MAECDRPGDEVEQPALPGVRHRPRTNAEPLGRVVQHTHPAGAIERGDQKDELHSGRQPLSLLQKCLLDAGSDGQRVG